MDPRMMNAWLAAQAQKAQISPADMQRKRLGVSNINQPARPIQEASTRPITPRNPRSGQTPMMPLADNQMGPGGAEMQPSRPGGFYQGDSIDDLDTITPEAAERLRRLGYSPQQIPHPRSEEESEEIRDRKLAKEKQIKPLTLDDNPFNKKLNEQLSAEEESYAKKHKHMLSSMIDQYGEEKGTKVFYATVRNKVRGK